MLPKAKRLTRHDILKFLKKSLNLSSAHFLLRIAPLPNPKDNPRVAVTVSSKVLKAAVGRNKLRRQSYAVLKDLYPLLKSGVVFQLSAKKPASALPYNELESEIKKVLKKANLI